MDTYRTLAEPSPEQLYKEKGSKFFSYAYPIVAEAEVRPILDALRKRHHGAVHFCYAWQLGPTHVSYRANDDGEPSHSAGAPIYGQLKSFGVTNALVVVVRFFGGVKLGVGGLISAYRTSAQMALAASEFVEKEIRVDFNIATTYANLNKAMRIIRENQGEVHHQRMELECWIEVSVPIQRATRFRECILTIAEIRTNQ